MKWSRAQGYYDGYDPVEIAEQALPRIKKLKNILRLLILKNYQILSKSSKKVSSLLLQNVLWNFLY